MYIFDVSFCLIVIYFCYSVIIYSLMSLSPSLPLSPSFSLSLSLSPSLSLPPFSLPPSPSLSLPPLSLSSSLSPSLPLSLPPSLSLSLPLFKSLGEDFNIIQQEILILSECKHANIVGYLGSYLRSVQHTITF